MSEEFDGFGDIVQHQTGIFGNDMPGMSNALHKHDSAQTVPAADGVHITMDCPMCGGARDITVDWGEVAALSLNVPPQNVFANHATPWVFTHQGWTPREVRCSNCVDRTELHPYITQQEAVGHVKTGQANGWPYFNQRVQLFPNAPPMTRYQGVIAIVQRAQKGA